MWAQLNKWIAPLAQRLATLVVKAIITNVSDSDQIQLVQVNMGNDEIIDSVERIQNFGFTSHPLVDSEAVVLCIGGNREHPIVIVADQGEKRPTLEQGESAVYNAEGLLIKLTKNKIIELGDTSPTPLIEKDGVLTGNTVNPVTGAPFAAVPTDVSGTVRAKH